MTYPALLLTLATLVLAGCTRGQGATGGEALPMGELFVRVTEGEAVTDGGFSRGVAWGDMDGDGDADLVVANTENAPEFIYRNDGGILRELHGVPPVLVAGWTEGVHWIDYDNDGSNDLFLTQDRDTPNALFHNDGAGRLTAVNAGDLTRDVSSSRQGCWADYDGDGDLDVYVANGGGEDDALYENRGDGTFRRVEDGPWVGKHNEARTCGAADADGDRLPDIYVGNFVSQESTGRWRAEDNLFFHNLGSLRFAEVTDEPIVRGGGLTYGISWVDFDGDGDLDLFVTNINPDDRNWLYENDGAGHFRLRDDLVPVTDSRGPSKGQTWADFDLDGDLDLFVANGTEDTGNVEDYDVRNFLYLNRGDATFVRVAAGGLVADLHVSAGAAWADYDLDGDVDLFVANWGGSDEDNDLYRNLTVERTGRSWVTVTLEGRQSNRMALGAFVRAKARLRPGASATWQVRWMLPATGYASENEPVIHFGLGQAARVDSLEVVWPSGGRQTFTDVPARKRWRLVEGGPLLEANRAHSPTR